MLSSKTKALVESAILIAIGTVLSLFKIAELPYGGSVTIASMLPVAIVSYRHGLKWGLGSGLVFGVVQQLLGLKNLTYFSDWKSIVAIILLDYVVAFGVIGLAGAFRRAIRHQGLSLAVGSLLVCVLRYACHVISGATVWAGLSIPSKAALIYSFAYNATYMLPETIVLMIAAYYVGSMIDFGRDQPVRIRKTETPYASALRLASVFLILGGFIFDVISIFLKLQDDGGNFVFAGQYEADVYEYGLEAVNWASVGVVSVIALVGAAVMFVFAARLARKEKQ